MTSCRRVGAAVSVVWSCPVAIPPRRRDSLGDGPTAEPKQPRTPTSARFPTLEGQARKFGKHSPTASSAPGTDFLLSMGPFGALVWGAYLLGKRVKVTSTSGATARPSSCTKQARLRLGEVQLCGNPRREVRGLLRALHAREHPRQFVPAPRERDEARHLLASHRRVPLLARQRECAVPGSDRLVCLDYRGPPALRKEVWSRPADAALPRGTGRTRGTSVGPRAAPCPRRGAVPVSAALRLGTKWRAGVVSRFVFVRRLRRLRGPRGTFVTLRVHSASTGTGGSAAAFNASNLSSDHSCGSDQKVL